MSNVLIDTLYQKFNDSITQIDCGSLFDPHVGIISRCYHRNLVKNVKDDKIKKRNKPSTKKKVRSKKKPKGRKTKTKGVKKAKSKLNRKVRSKKVQIALVKKLLKRVRKALKLT